MKKIKINKFELLILITALVVFFEPQSFKDPVLTYQNSIDYIYKVLKLALSSIILIIYFRKIKISKMSIFMIIYQLICFVSTIVNRGDVIRFFGPALTAIIMIMIAEILIHSDNLYKVLEKIIIYFRIIFAINIVSLLIIDYINSSFNGGIAFLGIDNRWIFTYLPWMLFEFMMYRKEKSSKKELVTFYVLSELTLIYRWSAAAMILSLLWIPVISKNSVIIKINNYIKYYALIIISNVLLVKFKIQYFFKNFLSAIHKDPTISGRTFLWDKIISDKSYYLLGHGMQSVAYDKHYFGTSSGAYNLSFLYVIHGHNSFMTILYRFGIIAIFTYLGILLYSFLIITKSKDKNKDLLFIFLIIFLCLSMFDTIDCAGLYFVLGIISTLQKKGEKYVKNN